MHNAASYKYEKGRDRQTSGLYGTRASTTDIRAQRTFPISHLCCSPCQPHSWASNSLLMARWLPEVLSKRMSVQRAPLYSPYWLKLGLVTITGRKKSLWVRARPMGWIGLELEDTTEAEMEKFLLDHMD